MGLKRKAERSGEIEQVYEKKREVLVCTTSDHLTYIMHMAKLKKCLVISCIILNTANDQFNSPVNKCPLKSLQISINACVE